MKNFPLLFVAGFAALASYAPFGTAMAPTTPEVAPAAKRIALLVGISDYRTGTNNQDGWSNLPIEPDLVNIERVLTDSFNFQVVGKLKDSEATQKAIVEAINAKLIAQAKPGDSVVFYYTGHGHQIADQPPGTKGSDGEPDLKDECLVTWVPKDQQALPEVERREIMYLRDDVFDGLLRRLSANMTEGGKFKGSITVILDTCHAGTGTKGIAIPKGRPWDEKIDGPEPAGRPETEGTGFDAVVGMPAGVVSIGGCASGQSSVMMEDTKLGSALTHFLCIALVQAAQKGVERVSYRDVFNIVEPQVSGQNRNQNPQIEGNLDALLFGDGTIKGYEPYLKIGKVIDGQPIEMAIQAGKVHGLTAGSTVSLFPAQEDVKDPSKAIGKAKIEQVDLFSATATVVEGSPTLAQLTNGKAIIADFAIPINLLKVYAPASHPMAGYLKSLEFVQVVTDEKAADVRWFQERTKGAPYWQRAGGAQLASGTIDAEELRDNLIEEWRWRELAQLAEAPGAPRIEISMVAVKPGTPALEVGQIIPESAKRPTKTEKGGSFLMEPGDEAYIVVRNRSFTSLYVNALYLAASGDIYVFPEPGQGSQAFAADGQDHVLLHLSDVSVNSSSGREEDIFKLIATRDPIDLQGVAVSKGDRSIAKGITDNPLENLLYGVRNGQAKGPKVTMKGAKPWGIATMKLVTRLKQ